MRTGTVVAGGVPLYEAVPEDPIGGVVVFQEAYGVNDYIQDVSGRLALAGYHAVAPHLFHRQGDVVLPYGDIPRAIEMIATLSDDGLLADADVAIGHLRANGFADRQIGCVGFCMGGRVTFLVAARRAIAAGVGFYGGGIVVQQFPQLAALVGEAATLKTPWLGLFGDRDGSIPVDQVEALRSALADASVPTGVVRYAEAGHGFHCDRRPQAFNEEAASDGWRRALAWFEENLGGS